jgi:hypothetical protein
MERRGTIASETVRTRETGGTDPTVRGPEVDRGSDRDRSLSVDNLPVPRDRAFILPVARDQDVTVSNEVHRDRAYGRSIKEHLHGPRVTPASHYRASRHYVTLDSRFGKSGRDVKIYPT